MNGRRRVRVRVIKVSLGLRFYAKSSLDPAVRGDITGV